jgi:hypothetical protein
LGRIAREARSGEVYARHQAAVGHLDIQGSGTSPLAALVVVDLMFRQAFTISVHC